MSGIRMIAEDDIKGLNAWLAKAGLRGEPEASLVSGFCERAVAAGLPISRAQVFIDTLHPVYEGRLVRWGHDPSQPVVYEYGRTGLPERASDLHLAAADVRTEDVARWRASPFFRMLQTGESLLRRRVTAESELEFSVLRDYRTAGITDSAPDEIIPLLNAYADVVVSAIHAQGGDVLKLIGDGILAIFTATDRARACTAALAAAAAARSEVEALNLQRARDGLPVTD